MRETHKLKAPRTAEFHRYDVFLSLFLFFLFFYYDDDDDGDALFPPHSVPADWRSPVSRFTHCWAINNLYVVCTDIEEGGTTTEREEMKEKNETTTVKEEE